MSDDNDDGGFFGFFRNLFYGDEKRKPPERIENERSRRLTEPAPEKQRASEKELGSGLHVKSVSFNIPENTEKHRTNAYECTEEHEVDGKVEAPELVLRRGQNFTITVLFDRPYDKQGHDLKFHFKTGKLSDLHKETHGIFKLDESGTEKHDSGKWYGVLTKQDGNTTTIDVHVPATCAIGQWSLDIVTIAEDEQGKTCRLTYEHSDNFYILFNPWCQDDQVYMKDGSLLDEYVLNDHGCVFKGNQYCPKAQEWNYGHFEAGMLDGSLHLIMKCFRPKMMYQLSDPAKVSRVIAQVVNCCDSDKGVLWGNWSGKYKGGASPGSWCGSVKILRQYAKTGKPVKYGQCWVFSGVTTTVCRAIGLPARSVTNYASAHDTDESNTIDKYYQREDNGSLELAKNSDSVWNFHVWNEVWMKRPDIEDKQCCYDGWQAIDATPQERSEGVFTCGPCSVEAIKNGIVNRPYDGSFIFSEVNADEVHWEPCPDGFRRFKLKTDRIGKSISTKKPDGKPYDSNCWFDRSRQDITDEYKFKDNSSENRTAVMRAACGARKPKDAYTEQGEKEDIVFKLLHAADLNYGQDVQVTLKATNTSSHDREITAVSFQFRKMSYTGTVGKAFKIDRQDVEVSPGRNEDHDFKTTLKFDEYCDQLDENKNMCIQAYALVKPSFRRPLQNCVKSHDVEFTVPSLEVKLPSSGVKGSPVEALVTFKNPLNTPLTDCTMDYESGGFVHKDDLKQDDVPALGTYKGKFSMVPKRPGKFTVTFRFSSKRLENLTGSSAIHVKRH